MKAISFAAALLCLVPSILFAQATRTWVSGVGDDANPCSRTAPCKTWAGAISKTAVGGEMNALDPGGFGALTITKAITVDGGSAFASVLASGTNGIVINLTTPGKVTLRNLSINGAGTGLSGVRVISSAASTLNLENVQIRNFGAGSNPAIALLPTAALDVQMLDVIVANCGAGLVATGATATARLSDTTLLDDNAAGCTASGGASIQSFGNNRLAANCAVTSTPLR